MPWSSSLSQRADAYRVLLVEDNPAEAELVYERLSSASPAFEITHALDMQRAARACGEIKFDCVVLDLQLPDTTGVDTIKSMRALCADAAIVAFSGMDDDFSREASLREGAQDFISKNGAEAGSLDRSILFALERWRALKLHRQLEAMLAALPDAVIVCGADGRVRFANEAAAVLMSPAGGLAGDKLKSLLDESAADIEIDSPRGKRICEIRIAPAHWDNEACLLAVIRDVTEQREMATRLRKFAKMEFARRFAGGLAHDFGNIVSCIDLVAQAGLRGGDGDSAAVARLGDIRAATKAARAIVDQLLSLEQSQTGSPEAVDVREVVEDSAKLLRQILPDGIELVVARPEALAPVLMDRSHLEQIVLNLALNARDAMSGGGVLRIQCEDRPGDYVLVSVSDTGCGIAMSDLDRVFEPHFTTKGAGSGIGLAICQAMVDLAGGVIKVKSRLGEGTSFSILLPKLAVAA